MNYKAEIIPINLEKHNNSDFLSICKVFSGYTCVCRTEDWLGKTKGCYLAPDTLVDTTRPEFDFLFKDGKYQNNSELGGTFARIKAKKIRGIYSYGLLVPVPNNTSLGEDWFEKLGLAHYEAPIKGNPLKGGLLTGGEAASPPSIPLPSYDVENFMRYSDSVFEEGEKIWVTLKYNGCCGRYVYHNGEFYAGSRHEWKKEFATPPVMNEQIKAKIRERIIDEAIANIRINELQVKFDNFKAHQNLWWKVLKNDENLMKFLTNNPEIAVYGEVVPVQGNKFSYGCNPENPKLFVFDIMKNGEWLDPIVARETAPDLNWVHIIFKDISFNKQELINYTENMPIIVNKESIEEGIVIKSMKEKWNSYVGRNQLKLISPKYLEKS